MRKLSNDGFNWTVDKQWIKEQLVKISNLSESDLERELIITPIMDNYQKKGTLFLSLNGSPPRGHAIYEIKSRRILFISWGFDKKKIVNNTIIQDITEFDEGN